MEEIPEGPGVLTREDLHRAVLRLDTDAMSTFVLSVAGYFYVETDEAEHGLLNFDKELTGSDTIGAVGWFMRDILGLTEEKIRAAGDKAGLNG